MPWFSPSDAPPWIGLDVGGANLKVADGRGRALSVPFALWREPQRLAGVIGELLEEFKAPHDASVALTMTGELADCFATKAEGVRAIVDAMGAAATGRAVRVATVDDRWISPEAAAESPYDVAAANWRLGARLVAQNALEAAVWVDAGSTTVDVIPTEGGRVASRGATDTDRLLAGELVYTGVRRTPVCAVVRELPYRGGLCPVMAEWFATTADAWLIAGDLAESPDYRDTADGRPLVLASAVDRLARCVGADRETFSPTDALAAASAVVTEQTKQIVAAVRRQPSPERCYVSGSGEFLARRAVQAAGADTVVSLSEVVGLAASSAFPAHAAAVLAPAESEAPG